MPPPHRASNGRETNGPRTSAIVTFRAIALTGVLLSPFLFFAVLGAAEMCSRRSSTCSSLELGFFELGPAVAILGACALARVGIRRGVPGGHYRWTLSAWLLCAGVGLLWWALLPLR